MLVRKNRYVRIRVIGGSGIFNTIMNIVRKPIVQKLLTSAGKSMASALVSRVMLPKEAAPIQTPTPPWVPIQTPIQTPARVPIQTPTPQELLAKYSGSGVISIQDYVKQHRGAGIKNI